MLHIIKKQSVLRSAVSFCQDDDVILLTEDAVYCANARHEGYHLLVGKTVFCLQEDVQARGIGPFIAESVTLSSYNDFVDLTEQYHPSMTWA